MDATRSQRRNRIAASPRYGREGVMARRFGRNQRRKMRTEVESLAFALRAEKHFRAKVDGELREIRSKLATVLRDQLAKGVVPLEVEHFLSRDQHNVIMHAIFDERRSNLHYQHQISPSDLIIKRDAEERDAFGLYLGRAIADRIAEAYAGRNEGTNPTRP
jgi:hypothetical protein